MALQIEIALVFWLWLIQRIRLYLIQTVLRWKIRCVTRSSIAPWYEIVGSMDTNCTPWAQAVLQYRCCSSVRMALLWHGRMDADMNLTLLSDIRALVSFIYLFLSLKFLPSQELAGMVCPFSIGHLMPVERTFSATETVIKSESCRGLRTCPSWCCCCILLSFPLPAVWRVLESRQQIQEQCVQPWDHRYPVYVGVFSFGFFLTFLYCRVSVPNKEVNGGNDLYSSHH